MWAGSWPSSAGWRLMRERLFCLGMAYITGLASYFMFTAWENPWLGMFVAVSAVGWLLQPYNHSGDPR